MTVAPLKPLSDDQARVYAAAEAYARARRVSDPYFAFEGAAGTGKTEVLARLAQRFPNSVMCAFAGKSASVLRARTGFEVTTIHSAIFDFKGLVDESDGRKSPVFVDKEGLDFSGRLVLLDEFGTVGMRLGESLLATGARVIACGDPYQLRPVRDSRFFDETNDALTEVHRQAWNSPIIRQAHRVKDGGEYDEDGDDFRVIPKVGITRDELAFGGIALCWRNLTRQRLNLSRRRAIGFGGPALDVGEPVMMLRNDYARRVFNGEIYRVATRRPQGEPDLQVEDAAGRSIVLRNVTVEGIDPEFDTRRYEDDWCPLSLAYACTTHKFIGSEDADILLVDEYVGNERQHWLYTAITRAAKRILIVRT